jgi:CRISPR/Cas system Type II protein with McrA/HNH and RuvC-like nuclease domain
MLNPADFQKFCKVSLVDDEKKTALLEGIPWHQVVNALGKHNT